MVGNDTAREFLAEYFGDALDSDHAMALWTKANKEHAWITDLEAAAYFAEIHKGEDCYFSVGTYPKDAKRRTQDNVTQIMGLWLDIDVGEKDNGRNYFPTMELALDWILREMAGFWSIIVHSGGGLHVYLLFDEPLDCRSMDDHTKARKLTKAFHAWASSRCEYDLDAVIDLSRVMRLPGTMNTKAGQQCHIIEITDNRKNAQEMIDLLPEVELTETSHVAIVDEDVDNDKLTDRIELMASADNTFRRTWQKSRNFKDNSPSSYCMSLANIFCEAGFSNAEIAVALKRWRTMHGASAKPDSWYATTIAKARTTHSGTKIEAQFDATISKALKEEATEEEPGAKSDATKVVTTEIFGSSLLRVVKVVVPNFRGVTAPPSYRLEFEGGSVELESSAELMSQQILKRKLFDEVGIVMKMLKGPKFDEVLRLFKAIEEVEEQQLEANIGFIVASTLTDLLASKIESVEVVEELRLFENHMIYKDEDGDYWFSFDLLVNRLSQKMSRRYDNADLSAALAKMGSRPHRHGTKRIRLWLIPKDMTAELM